VVKWLISNGHLLSIHGEAELTPVHIMANEILVTALEAAAQAAQVVGSMIPGVGGIIARIAGVTFASAAAIANSGKDPEVEIRRIHEADPLIASVKEKWLQAIKDKFGKKTSIDEKFEVPAPPDTEVDIYEK
jgi:hypothetical protein